MRLLSAIAAAKNRKNGERLNEDAPRVLALPEAPSPRGEPSRRSGYAPTSVRPSVTLVADHLARGAESAQEPELVVARPAGEGSANDARPRHGEEEQDADVERDDLERNRDRARYRRRGARRPANRLGREAARGTRC